MVLRFGLIRACSARGHRDLRGRFDVSRGGCSGNEGDGGNQDESGLGVVGLINSIARNHTQIVYRCRQVKVELLVRANQGVEIGHGSLAPKERAAVVVDVAGLSDDLTQTVDRIADTVIVAGEGSQILHDSVLPEEGATGQIAGHIRGAGHLGEIVDGEGIGVQRAAKVAKVNRVATFPNQAMCGGSIHAVPRGAYGLV